MSFLCRKSLMEMLRVLRVGGRCLVYVWARDQRRGERNSTYLSEKRLEKTPEDPSGELRPFGLPVHTNRSNFKHADLLVPWKLVSGFASFFNFLKNKAENVPYRRGKNQSYSIGFTMFSRRASLRVWSPGFPAPKSVILITTRVTGV